MIGQLNQSNNLEDIYRDDLLEEARDPSYFGKLENPDIVIEDFNASCGDRVKVMIRLSANNKIIKDLRWSGEGCLISRVSMSRLAAMVIGQSLEAVSQITSDELKSALNLENLTPMRSKCVSLGLVALQKAISSRSY